MGKKSKKLKEADDPQPSKQSEHLPEIMKLKKKKKKNLDLNPDNIFVASEDIAECEQIVKAEQHELQNSIHVKKKQKKKRHLIDEQISEESTEVSKVDDDPEVPKKKKKVKLLQVEETNQEIDQLHYETGELQKRNQKFHKQKKIIDNEFNENEKHETKPNVKIMVEAKGPKKKSKSKTGNAVLNKEESQVTEEDIERFCDELDEEDNKQYEDWVKLIEASLPQPRA